METDKLNPLIPVSVRGERVEVREMNWKDSLRAVKEMTGAIMTLVNNKGEMVLDKTKIIEALTSQEALASWVIQKSTDKDGAWVDSLSTREFLPIIIAVVDLNLSDEVIGSGKTLAGRMGKVLGLKTISPKQSTT
jgi:hypothetical protein